MRRGSPSARLLLAATVLAAAAAADAAAWHECSAQGGFGGLYGSQAVANLTAWRTTLLDKLWRTFDTSVPIPEDHKRYDPFSPFNECPPGQPLRRYGNAADGGKQLCDVGRLHQPCLIVSLGSAGDYSFERDMLNATKCDIHTFDCTFDGKSIDRRHTYHKLCVGAGGGLFRSWAEVTDKLLGGRAVDVAKIDIEGHEPAVLAELRHDVPLPRQIVIEMHLRNEAGRPTVVAQPAPRQPAHMALLFSHLASLGFGIVAREDNIWGEPGCCAEFTLLHVEQLRPSDLLHHRRRGRHHGAALRLPGSGGANAGGNLD